MVSRTCAPSLFSEAQSTLSLNRPRRITSTTMTRLLDSIRPDRHSRVADHQRRRWTLPLTAGLVVLALFGAGILRDRERPSVERVPKAISSVVPFAALMEEIVVCHETEVTPDRMTVLRLERRTSGLIIDVSNQQDVAIAIVRWLQP